MCVCVWNALSEAVYRCLKTKFSTLEELKQPIVITSDEITFDPRHHPTMEVSPERVVRSEGGAIAHALE